MNIYNVTDKWIECFVNKYTIDNAYAFDGTINKLPKETSQITFIKKNIGFSNDNQNTNLHDIIDVNECIFVKIDIEGVEIPWIKSLSNEQIVMEFHHPFLHNEIDVFDKINKNHYLIHFHGINCCGTRNYNGVIIPNVYILT